MGLFDKMFGRDAKDEKQETFNELRTKYQSVLNTIESEDVQVRNLHVEGDKLFIKGVAPSEDAKNRVWDQIKQVDTNYKDLNADISVNPSLGVSQTASGAESYTVKSGDTLSEISRQYYGNPNEYMRIFYANRDKLNDPNQIQVGQQLVIPKE
jgi:LysM repeat protein